MKKLKILFVVVTLLFSLSALINGSVLIKRKYIALLIYTRDTTAGAGMSVHLFRKSLTSALKNLYSSHIYNPYKVAVYYTNNVINKENFARMQKNMPVIDYFVTARLYNQDRDISPYSSVKARITIYRIRERVKRSERFFTAGRLNNYETMVQSICKNVTTVTKLPMSHRVNFLPYDIISQYARGKYFLTKKDYLNAINAFRLALDKSPEVYPEMIKEYVKSLIKREADIPGLKPAGENSLSIELTAALYYEKKKDFKKALEYALSYQKRTKESEVVIQSAEPVYKTIQSANYFVTLSANKANVYFKSNPAEKVIHEISEEIKSVNIINDLIIINGKTYEIKKPGVVLDKILLINHDTLSVSFEQRDNAFILVHQNKGKTNSYQTDSLVNTTIHFRHPLYILTSGKHVFVFGRLSGRLIWQQTLEYEIKNIQTSGTNVILIGKDSYSYFILENGRLIKFKKYKGAEKLVIDGSAIATVYRDKIFYEDTRIAKKWNKSFHSFKIIDTRIINNKVNVILSDSEAVSYYYILSETGEEIFRKIIYGKLIDANISSNSFFFQNYFAIYPERRNTGERETLHFSLSLIYQGLNNFKESLFYTLKVLNDNPLSFAGLKRSKKILSGISTQSEKEMCKEAFAGVFGKRFLKIPGAEIIDKLTMSYILYPFYKDGYIEILKLSGFGTPDKFFSLNIGAVKTYKILNDFLVVSLKTNRVDVIKLETGKIIWSMNRFQLIDHIQPQGEKIFLYNASDRLLLCVNYKTGGLLWMNTLAGVHPEGKINITMIDNKIIAFSKTGSKTKISGIEPSNGNSLYSKETEGSVYYDRQELFIFLDNKLKKINISEFSDLWNIDMENSEVKFTFTTDFIVASYAKKIAFIRRDNGSKNRALDFPHGFITHSAGENGNLLVLFVNSNGKKTLGLYSKANKIEIEIKNEEISKIVLPNGYAFIAGGLTTRIREGNSLKPVAIFNSIFSSINTQNENYYLFTNAYCVIYTPNPMKLIATALLKKQLSNFYYYFGGIISNRPL